jgi:hypothetical protein
VARFQAKLPKTGRILWVWATYPADDPKAGEPFPLSEVKDLAFKAKWALRDRDPVFTKPVGNELSIHKDYPELAEVFVSPEDLVHREP